MLISTLMVSALALVTPDDMQLPIGRDNPDYRIFESSGLATENAKASARMTKESVLEWCDANRPEEDKDECVGNYMVDTVYQASANCKTGLLTDTDGEQYQYLGKETKDANWLGYPTFKDAKGKKVPMSYAGGGIGVAAMWWTLCPNVTPYDIQPLKTKLEKSDFSKNTKSGTLDGKKVIVDYGKGVISDTGNNVLFRGTIIKNGPIVGIFYKQAEGCDAVPYIVEGHTNTDQKSRKILSLAGAEPSLEGCKVVGKKENFQMTVTLK